MLAHPARKGEVVWGKPSASTERYGDPVQIPGVPAVLSPERFAQVQEALGHRHSKLPAAKRTYPLTGRLTSPCGRGYYSYGQESRPPLYR
jgi:hypothetical protein